MTAGLQQLRQQLAAAMEQRGDWPNGSPWIRHAVDALPRDGFAPDRLWAWAGRAYEPIDRGTEPQRWAQRIYGNPDAAAVTQIRDGLPSSSLSCQAVVVGMLDLLHLEPGHRVLELGTGTGWNAALLTHRAGPGRVTSVEVDPVLAASARQRLDAAGVEVTVQVGDGAEGWPLGAPYDRIIATYAVDHVPWAWVQQTRPGGRIVTPWGSLGHVALTVAEDGRSATGPVAGLAQFMAARGTPAGRTWQQIRGHEPTDPDRTLVRDLTPLRDDQHLRFALRVRVPDVQIMTGEDDDGINAWLHDGTASWATLSAIGDGRTQVYQGGPRRLADEIETAWDWWLSNGRPDVYDFGLTVQPDRQYAWCRDPDGRRWPISGAAEAQLAR